MTCVPSYLLTEIQDHFLKGHLDFYNHTGVQECKSVQTCIETFYYDFEEIEVK